MITYFFVVFLWIYLHIYYAYLLEEEKEENK